MGFGTDPSIYSNSYGLSSAASFLQRLGDNITVQSHTVLTPHCYGDQVTGMMVSRSHSWQQAALRWSEGF